MSEDRQQTSDEWTEQVNKRSAMTDHAQQATVFKTTVLGVGPWCVEFPDGEIVTTCTEERANLIANAAQAHAAGRLEGLDEAAELADEYPQRDPAEDGNGYWAAQEIAQAIRAKAKEAGQ